MHNIQIDSISDGNIIPVNVENMTPYVNIRGLACHKNNSAVQETYHQFNIRQLGVCTVRLRHKYSL